MSTLKEINVEKLIASVFRRVPLWDQKSMNHHNRYVLDKLWDEVADEMKSSRDVVRTKWKTLRDTFRREVKKVPIKQSADSSYESSWQYFDSLYFLNDQFTARSNSRNITKNETNMAEDDSAELSHWNSELLNDFNTNERDDETNIFIPAQNLLKRKMQSDVDNAFIRIEEGKQMRSEYDEDESFFQSLLPHIRTLTQQKKMLLRMKIQEIVYSFVYEDQRPNQDSSKPS